MLLPAMTDTKWFHKYIYGRATIRFISGRLKFGGSKNSAPFPSMIVIFLIRRAKDMGIYSISVVILVAAFFLGFCIGSLITSHATVKEIRKRNEEGKE